MRGEYVVALFLESSERWSRFLGKYSQNFPEISAFSASECEDNLPRCSFVDTLKGLSSVAGLTFHTRGVFSSLIALVGTTAKRENRGDSSE